MAERVSKILGRKIEYEEVDQETRAKQYLDCGKGERVALRMALLETITTVQEPNDVVQKVCGRPGATLDEWLAENGDKLK